MMRIFWNLLKLEDFILVSDDSEDLNFKEPPKIQFLEAINGLLNIQLYLEQIGQISEENLDLVFKLKYQLVDSSEKKITIKFI